MSGELNHEDITHSLSQLSLKCVELGDYLLVIRSNLDVFIDNEPYLASMLILNKHSGTYTAKLWNKTLFSGKNPTATEFIQVCKQHFGQGKPCVGFRLQVDEEAPHEGILSSLPISRNVAKDCHKFLNKDAGDDNLCSACKKLSISKSLSNVTVSNVPDVGRTNEETSPKTEQNDNDKENISSEDMKFEDSHLDPLLDESDLEPVSKQHVLDKQLEKNCPWCNETISCCGDIDAFQKHRTACLMLVLKRRAKGRDDNMKPENENGHVKDEISDTEAQVCEIGNQRRDGSTTRSLVIKQTTQRTTPNDLMCLECKKNFDTEASATLHKKFVHFWGIFVCPECREQFHFADDIILHIRHEAGHIENCKVKCPSCRDECSLTNIANHYKRCIIKEIQREKFGITEEPMIVERQYKGVPKREQRVICTQCGKIFKNTDVLLRHNRIHLREQGAEKDDTPGKEPLYYNCEHCGKIFVSKTGMVQHRRLVHEGVHQKATCKICDITFITRDRLWRHKNMYHASNDTYRCKYCNKQCSTRSWLARHIASNHEEPKFKCSYCEKSFTFKHKLEGHENEHKGVKPYSCKECGVSYHKIGGLSSHMKKKHGFYKVRGNNMLTKNTS